MALYCHVVVYCHLVRGSRAQSSAGFDSDGPGLYGTNLH